MHMKILWSTEVGIVNNARETGCEQEGKALGHASKGTVQSCLKDEPDVISHKRWEEHQAASRGCEIGQSPEQKRPV